ncbi:MAG: alpha/beta hydrolase [Ruegeria sp.]
MRFLPVLAAIVWLAACTDRSSFVVVPDAVDVGTPRTVFAASARAREADGSYGYRRANRLQFLELTVSIPPTHTPGSLNFSYGRPDPETQFVLAEQEVFTSAELLGRRLLDDQREHGSPVREVTLFVHGYNATQNETAFRAAQLANDIEIPGSLMIYSWPSRARAFGYAYDLDSMLFARDGLEQTIRQLKASGAERIVLVAHSMGAALSMEMMRQAEIREPGWSDRMLEGVVLISPDLDVDVFRTQMDRIGTVPQPFVVMVSRKDPALNISARLRGTAESRRLGNIDSIDRIADYPVDVIDTTAFSGDAASRHFVAATSPALVTLLSSAPAMGEAFGPEETSFDFLIPDGVEVSGRAKEIILARPGEDR